MKIKIFFALLSFGFLCHAEEGIYNVLDPRSGQSLYEIVSKDVPKRAPGIYKFDNKGKAVQVINGNVLGLSRRFNGVLSFVSKGSVNQSTATAISLVDGYITIYNHNSKPDKKDSFIQIGKGNHKVYDPVLGTPVQLAPIVSLEDFSIEEVSRFSRSSDVLPNSGTVYLASVRSANPFGDGLTFAFVIEGNGTLRDGVKVFENRFTVLNYKYTSGPELSKIATDEARLVFSQIGASSLMRRLQSFLPSSLIKKWTAYVDSEAKRLSVRGGASKKSAGAGEAVGVPLLDLLWGQVLVLEYPAALVADMGQGRRLYQVFDPDLGRWYLLSEDNLKLSTQPKSAPAGLLFVDGSEVKTNAILEGQVKETSTGYHVVKSSIAKSKQSHEAMVFAGDQSLILLEDEGIDKGFAFARLPVDYFGARSVDFYHEEIVGKDAKYHALFVSSQSATGKKSLDVYFYVRSRSELQLIHSMNLMDKAVITAEEIQLRMVTSNGGLLFDSLSPAQGLAAYKARLKAHAKARAAKGTDKGDEVEDIANVPYADLDSAVRKKSAELAYIPIKSEIIEEIIPGKVVYRKFMSAGKNVQNRTGFYIDSKFGNSHNFDPMKLAEETVVSGVPLARRNAKGPNKYVMESALLDVKNLSADNFQVTVFPYFKDLEKTYDPNTSKVALAVHASLANRSNSRSSLRTMDLNLPLGNIVAVRIVQGARNVTDEFTILLFLGAGSKKPGESGFLQGVHAAHVTLKVDYSKGDEPAVVMNVGRWVNLAQDFVSPSTLKYRLKSDAEGNYYWIDTPEINPAASQFRVRKLQEATTLIYPNRPNSRLILRLKENYVGNASSAGKDSFGNWRIMANFDLKSREPDLETYVNDLMDKAKKDSGKKQTTDYNYVKAKDWLPLHKIATPQFTEFLDKLASNRSAQASHQVVLVEPAMKELFIKQLQVQLLEGNGPFSLNGSQSRNFDFYIVDPTSSAGEVQTEFEAIREGTGARTSLVMADLAKLNEAGPLIDEDGTSTEPVPSDQDEDEDDTARRGAKNPSRWTMLASEGSLRNPRAFRKVKTTNKDVPMLFIATPDEWRTTLANNPDEYENGVFDSFDLNYDFLTSSWTLWPPESEKAKKETKELARMPVSPEEYRVFPTLEKILFSSAEGKLKGKQMIILVPEEIKPLVERLILTRWASSSQKLISPWSKTNPKLAVFQINGERSDNSQDAVFDNFKAIKGASQRRSAVLLGDLSHIQKIGRPFNEGRGAFQLKDPANRGGVAGDMFRSTQSGARDSSAPKGQDPGSLGVKVAKLQEDLASVEEILQNAKLEADPFSTLLAILQQRDLTPAELKSLHPSVQSAFRSRNSIKSELDQMDLGSDAIAALETEDAQKGATLPHLMWLIAAEGDEVQPSQKRGWDLGEVTEPQGTTILVGTESELNQIEQDLAFESRFLDLRKQFEIVQLEPPTSQVRFELISALFDRPEIRSMGLEFQLDGKSSDETRRQLMYHFVNRVEQMAIQLGIEGTTAFIRAFSEFKRSLSEDVQIRRSRVIDKKFMERLFSKSFAVPLSFDNLEPDDPLLKLRDVDAAARQLQDLGYHGPVDLRVRTIETVLSQTRGSDGGRPIPNSQILFGGTSNGKTFLFEKMVQLLGLKEYDPAKPNNEDAEYITIKVQNLVETDTTESEKMSVQQAIANIQDLLSQPKGSRAWILIDDGHKAANGKIQEQLFSYIQSLFEANRGMVKAKRKATGEIREVPAQNLNVMMTVNPSSERDMIKKFVGEDGDIKGHVLAALARPDYKIEESFLARWSEIVNVDAFPRGAKVPALVERIRAASLRTGRIVLVEPDAIGRLVDRYPNAHAREFLSPASDAMTSIPATAPEALLYLVSPRKSSDGINKEAVAKGDYLSSTELSKSVRELTQVEPVESDNMTTQLRLIGFLMQGFRTQLFNHLVLSAINSETLLMSVPGHKSLFRNEFVTGAVAHMALHPRVPLGYLHLRGDHYSHLSQIQFEELYESAAKDSLPAGYFPVDLAVPPLAKGSDGQDIVSRSQSSVVKRFSSRKEVLAHYTTRVETLLLEFFVRYLRLESLAEVNEISRWSTSDVAKWFESLPMEDRVEDLKLVTEELLKILKEFRNALYDPALIEMKGQSKNADLNFYSQTRLFSYVIDKALTRLPWGLGAKMVMDISQGSRDLSLGQRPSFIKYAFSHEVSPFAIVTSEFLDGAPLGVGKISDKKVAEREVDFKRSCEVLLQAAPRGGTIK